MTTDDVKDALTNYHSYKKRLENANLELIAITTKQTKTGGSIIKIPERPTDRTKFMLKCIADKTEIERRCAYWRDMVYLAEAFIRSTQGRAKIVVYDKYVLRMNNYDLEAKHNLTRQGIDKIIHKSIERYVQKVEG